MVTVTYFYLTRVTGNLLALATRCDTEPSSKSPKVERPFAPSTIKSNFPDLAVLMARYTAEPRTEMDLADATLVWLAQDTNTLNVMTMDVRDFSRYRLPDGRSFLIH